MNSAALPAIDHLHDEPWDDVRRIYRRICLLRATGHHAEALDLEIDPLAKALASARATANNEQREAAVLAEEAERVANASLLAELMAPLLAEKLAARAPASPPTPQSTARAPSSFSRPAASPPGAGSAPAPTKSPSGSPPSITDLIDGMLSQAPASPGSGRR